MKKKKYKIFPIIVAIFVMFSEVFIPLKQTMAATESNGKWNYTINEIDSTATITKWNGSVDDTAVIIPDSIDGYNVTSIGEKAFFNCASLKSVTIPDSVTSIGDYAFYYCEKLTSMTIPNSVTSIGNYAFYDCTSLTSVTIPDSVTSIGANTFNHCKSLTSVIIPDSVTSIGVYAFYYCTSLTSVVIPDSITNIGEYAFSACQKLTSVTIPNSVTSISGNAFYFCTNLKSVSMGNNLKSIGYSAFYNCTSLTSVIIPDGVNSISGYAFYNCTSLTSVIIPDSVKGIGGYAFVNCENLANVTIKNSLVNIDDNAFWCCPSLTVDKITIYKNPNDNDTYKKFLVTGVGFINITQNTTIADNIMPINNGTATVDKYNTAGIIGVTAENIDAINTAVNEANSAKGSKLLSSEIQDTVDKVIKPQELVLTRNGNELNAQLKKSDGSDFITGTVVYDWYRDGSAISGQNQNKYDLTISDKGTNIKVKVSQYSLNSNIISIPNDPAPTVTAVNLPSNGVYNCGQELNFIVNFSESVTVIGDPYICLNIGGKTVRSIYYSGSGSTTLLFRYTIVKDDSDSDGITSLKSITRNGGNIKSSSTNMNASLILNSIGSTANINIDSVVPTVSSIIRDGSTPTNASDGLDFIVSFSKPVTGVDKEDFIATTTGSILGTTDIIITSGVSGSSTYTVHVSGLKGTGTVRLDLNSFGTGINDTAANFILEGYTSGEVYEIVPETTDVIIPIITTAAAVTIEGPDSVGNTLSAEFLDNAGNKVTTDSAVTYGWYRLEDSNSNFTKEIGTSKTYDLTNDDLEKYIGLSATYAGRTFTVISGIIKGNTTNNNSGSSSKHRRHHDSTTTTKTTTTTDATTEGDKKTEPTEGGKKADNIDNAETNKTDGWIKTLGKWQYFINGQPVTGWKQIDGKWYLFDSTGTMQVGWKEINKVWYLLKDSGEMAIGWQMSNGEWYFMKDNGAMAKGWQEVNGIWYLLKDNGEMAIGWQDTDGQWYYLYSDGAMAKNTSVDGYSVGDDGAWIQ